MERRSRDSTEKLVSVSFCCRVCSQQAHKIWPYNFESPWMASVGWWMNNELDEIWKVAAMP
jgi:hypothetical protein